MAVKVFITGATGYIGGDALVEIANAHPDWDITCSVRNSDKGAKVVSDLPTIKLAYGDLDSIEMIEEESSKADIVYHFADCDHQPSAEAIIRGLARRESSSPGFLIHTSGTMILAWETIKEETYGETRSKVYDDWEGINDLTSQPDIAAHRHVDKIVLAASQKHPDTVKTAIVCPPTIYGQGRGPGNQKSQQVNKATQAFLKGQQAFMVNKGQNIWHEVHVHDLSKLFLLLGEAAAAGGPPATWNDQGYYLAENGSFIWGQVLEAVAKEANRQGLLPTADIKQVSGEETNKLMSLQWGKKAIGTDSQGKAIRGRQLLGWKPQEKSLMEEIPAIVTGEAKDLGLIKGHAEQVLE